MHISHFHVVHTAISTHKTLQNRHPYIILCVCWRHMNHFNSTLHRILQTSHDKVWAGYYKWSKRNENLKKKKKILEKNVCKCTSHRMLRPMIHDDPTAPRLWSLFITHCGSEAFPEVPNGRVVHPEPSGDFSSRESLLRAIPEPARHPVYPPCVLEACLFNWLPPFKYPLLPNRAWVVLRLVSACVCIMRISSRNIVASGKSGKNEVIKSRTVHISDAFVSTVTDQQCLQNRVCRPIRRCLRWRYDAFYGWLHIR